MLLYFHVNVCWILPDRNINGPNPFIPRGVLLVICVRWKSLSLPAPFKSDFKRCCFWRMHQWDHVLMTIQSQDISVQSETSIIQNPEKKDSVGLVCKKSVISLWLNTNGTYTGQCIQIFSHHKSNFGDRMSRKSKTGRDV